MKSEEYGTLNQLISVYMDSMRLKWQACVLHGSILFCVYAVALSLRFLWNSLLWELMCLGIIACSLNSFSSVRLPSPVSV